MSDQPSTPPRLEDLRVSTLPRDDGDPYYMMDWGPEWEQLSDLTRPVTPADLLAVLISMGAETRTSYRVQGFAPVINAPNLKDPDGVEYLVIRKDALEGSE